MYADHVKDMGNAWHFKHAWTGVINTMPTIANCESAGSTGHSGTDSVVSWYLQTAVPPQHSQSCLDNCCWHILQWMIKAN